MEDWSIMRERKFNKVYHFSVEGQCEQLYLRHLQDLINGSESAYNKVRLNAKVSTPVKYVKSITVLDRTEIHHMHDVESEDADSKQSFNNMIEDLNKAKRLGKKITYHLCYSNLSFEVWLLWHKTDFFKNYMYPKEYLSDINKAYGMNFTSFSEYKKEANFKMILSKICLEDVINAIKRFEKMKQKYEETDYISCKGGYRYCRKNPSSNVGEIVALILKDCKLI